MKNNWLRCCCVVMLATFVSPAIAGDVTLKLETIKSLYQFAKINQENGNSLIAVNADNKLKKALKIQQLASNRGQTCGLDYDLMWQSQDPFFDETLHFQLNKSGLVRVTIGKNGTVSYALTCQQNKCLIRDVYDQTGSIKNNILHKCR